MKIDYVLLCDYASPADRNKLTAVNIFDFITTHTLPVTHPGAYLVIAQRFDEPDDVGKAFKIEVQCTHESGEVLFEGALEGKASRRPGAPATPRERIHHVLELKGLKFKHAGHYKIDVRLDGVPDRGQWFDVRVLKANDTDHSL